MSSANKKKSFILHKDTISDILVDYNNEEKGIIFQAIVDYQNGCFDEDFAEKWVNRAIRPLISQFKRDDEKYEKTRAARAKAGSKGGKQKVANASKCYQELTNDSKSKQKVAKVADSVSDNVNVNGNVSDNVNVDSKLSSIPSYEKFKKWGNSIGKNDEWIKKLFDKMNSREWKSKDGSIIENWKTYCNAIAEHKDWRWGNIGDEDEDDFKKAVIYLYDIARSFLPIDIARSAIDRDDLPQERLEYIRKYVKLYDKLGKNDNEVQQIYRDYKSQIFNSGRGAR